MEIPLSRWAQDCLVQHQEIVKIGRFGGPDEPRSCPRKRKRAKDQNAVVFDEGVVSVSMLTEGWDANTVTHVLGIRAFGTQLLREQVRGRGPLGRALRCWVWDRVAHRFVVELRLAAFSAEVVGVSLVEGLRRGVLVDNLHPADRVGG
jgi:hypothetical protein